MGIEQKVGNKDNTEKLRHSLTQLGLSKDLISETFEALERSYVELENDINGRYYSGCCV